MTARTNENIRFTMNHFYGLIEETEKNIKRLRSECPHEHTKIGNVKIREGSYCKMNVCEYCDTVTGPVEEELQDEQQPIVSYTPEEKP
jgi:hypothetical protein